MGQYVKVADLPQAVRNGLESVGYGRKDIEVDVRATVSMSSSAGNGRQGFVSLVNLSTNRHETIFGSWGGQNMFNKSNPVDNDTRSFPLPADGVAIVGVRGGGQPVWAKIYASTAGTQRSITSAPADVSDVEKAALGCYRSLKSGPYRQDALRRNKVTDDVIKGLVAKGLLKQARNGATQITTNGKNAAGSYHAY